MQDSKAIKGCMVVVNELSEFAEQEVNKLIESYCSELDGYMEIIDDALVNTQLKEISNEQLDTYVLNLTSLLYFVGDTQEKIGIKEDISKAIKTEAYNDAKANAEGTVAQKEAQAFIASQTESIVNIIYNRVYKSIKYKVDAGYEMLNSIKKVISRRIAEAELSNSRYANRISGDKFGK